MSTTWSTCGKQEGLFQNKVTASLTSTQRPGHKAHNYKMAYYTYLQMEWKGELQCIDVVFV